MDLSAESDDEDLGTLNTAMFHVPCTMFHINMYDGNVIH